jgi:hypothetical protein
MRTPQDIATDYIALWNESDGARRKALLARTWGQTASYVDPLMKGAGHAEIDGLIATVQQRFPGFRFTLIGAPDGHGDVAPRSPASSISCRPRPDRICASTQSERIRA